MTAREAAVRSAVQPIKVAAETAPKTGTLRDVTLAVSRQSAASATWESTAERYNVRRGRERIWISRVDRYDRTGTPAARDSTKRASSASGSMGSSFAVSLWP